MAKKTITRKSQANTSEANGRGTRSGTKRGQKKNEPTNVNYKSNALSMSFIQEGVREFGRIDRTRSCAYVIFK